MALKQIIKPYVEEYVDTDLWFEHGSPRNTTVEMDCATGVTWLEVVDT